MTKFGGLVVCASLVSVVGIVASMPLVVTAATMVACGTLLAAVLAFFDALEA